MPKIVAIFPSHETAVETSKILLDHNIADYSLDELSYDYESPIRQELFLSRREGRVIALTAVIGIILGLLLFYWLTLSPVIGALFSWLLGGGLPVALFTGGGLGAASGSLLAGLYVLSAPLKQDYKGRWLFVLYCRDNAQLAEAKAIIKVSPGFII